MADKKSSGVVQAVLLLVVVLVIAMGAYYLGKTASTNESTTDTTYQNKVILATEEAGASKTLIATEEAGVSINNETLAVGSGIADSYTPEQVIELLVPNEAERRFMAIPRKLGNGGWLVETAKTGTDGDGHPCCGVVVTFALSAGGEFDYWGGFEKPIGSGFTVNAGTDASSSHAAWHVGSEVGSNGTFKSDGVSWYPKDAKSTASTTGCDCEAKNVTPQASATRTPASVKTPTAKKSEAVEINATWLAANVGGEASCWTYSNENGRWEFRTSQDKLHNLFYPGFGKIVYGVPDEAGGWKTTEITANGETGNINAADFYSK